MNLQGKYACSFQTNIARGTNTIRVLEDFPSGSQPLEILIIGIGIDARPLLCTYEIYNITAYLEHRNLPYNLAVNEIEKELIESFLIRIFIFFPSFFYSSSGTFWDNYLKWTNQERLETHKLMEGLEFSVDLNEQQRKDLLERGILYAKIPRDLEEKIKSGNINIYEGCVSEVCFPIGQFDIIACENVLYHLDRKEKQRKALLSLVTSLKKGGILILNDILKAKSNIHPRYSGWLNDREEENLGIELYSDFLFESNESMAITFAYRKV